MGNLFHTTDHELWVAAFLPSHGYGGVGLAAAGVSLGLVAIGGVISTLGDLIYFTRPGLYLGAFATFWMFVALGLVDDVYLDVWNDARSAFATDDSTYRTVVTHHLEHIHDTRRILLVAAALWIPYMLLVTVSHTPSLPFHTAALEFLYDGQTTYDSGVPAILLVGVFGAVNGVLIATILNGFVEHLALVEDVADLPFQNLQTGASDLEPIAELTVASATMWFAGTTLVVLWTYTGLSGTVGTLFIALLVATGVAFFLAPQLILHDALVDAKRTEVNAIQAEYRSLHRAVTESDAASDEISLELDIIDRRLETAQAARTWVYNLSSMGKLVTAAVFPWLGLLQKVADAWTTLT